MSLYPLSNSPRASSSSGDECVPSPSRLAPLDKSRWIELEMTVDTGATLTKISRSLSLELGLVREGTVQVRFGDGRTIEQEVASAVIRCDGRRRIVPVSLCGDSEPLVLGATASRPCRSAWIRSTSSSFRRRCTSSSPRPEGDPGSGPPCTRRPAHPNLPSATYPGGLARDAYPAGLASDSTE